MLLVVDVGNTNIKLGIYDKDKLVQSWRLSVKVARTADEFGISMDSLFFSLLAIILYSADITASSPYI